MLNGVQKFRKLSRVVLLQGSNIVFGPALHGFLNSLRRGRRKRSLCWFFPSLEEHDIPPVHVVEGFFFSTDYASLTPERREQRHRGAMLTEFLAALL